MIDENRMHHLHASLLLVFACAPEVIERPTPPRPVPAEDAGAPVESAPVGATAPSPAQCEVDADCVAATCCSAKTCVPHNQKPECTGMLCNDACVAGVDDVYCNGRCTCVQGQCGVHFAPNPKVRMPPPSNG